MIDFEHQPFKFGEEIEVSDYSNFSLVRVARFIVYDETDPYSYKVSIVSTGLISYKYARPIKKQKEVFEWLRINLHSGAINLCDRIAETEQEIIQRYDRIEHRAFRFIKTGRSFMMDV